MIPQFETCYLCKSSLNNRTNVPGFEFLFTVSTPHLVCSHNPNHFTIIESSFDITFYIKFTNPQSIYEPVISIEYPALHVALFEMTSITIQNGIDEHQKFILPFHLNLHEIPPDNLKSTLQSYALFQ